MFPELYPALKSGVFFISLISLHIQRGMLHTAQIFQLLFPAYKTRHRNTPRSKELFLCCHSLERTITLALSPIFMSIVTCVNSAFVAIDRADRSASIIESLEAALHPGMATTLSVNAGPLKGFIMGGDLTLGPRCIVQMPVNQPGAGAVCISGLNMTAPSHAQCQCGQAQ